MQIPFALLFAVLFSVETIAAPVASLGNESGLEVRKAKAVAKKAPVKAKPAAKKPVAKKPVAKKPVAKKPVAKKPVAKKPIAKPAAKPVAKPVKKPVKAPVAKRPAAVKAKPAAKKVTPVKAAVPKKAAPIKKPATKAKAPATKKKVVKATTAKRPAPRPPATKKPVVKANPPKKAVPPKKAPTKAAPAKKPAASACPLPGAKKAAPAKAKASKPKRMLNEFTRRVAAFAHEVEIADRTLFGLIQPRLTSGNEFVGWHGTNINTATLWETRGEIVRPTNVEGQTIGKSGLDSELGPGLYISDTLSVAEAAAAINSQTNKVAGKVCAIFAKSSSSWRSSVDKVQVPEIIRGNANVKEQERASYITNLPPAKKGGAGTMRIGPLRGLSTNQMLIPENQNPKFEAQCFDITGLDSADAQAFEKNGNKITYTSSSLISSWKIRKEDADLAKATVAAIEKKCP